MRIDWRFLVASSLFLMLLLRTTPCTAKGFSTRECAGRKINIFSLDKKTWVDARKACTKIGSVLSQIRSPEDMECIREAAVENKVNYWLGGKRENPDEDCKANANDANPCRHDAWDGFCKEFYWLQPRVKIAQDLWATSGGNPEEGFEPDNLNCGEDCVEVNTYQNGINDLNCTDLNGYICDADPAQPTSDPNASDGTATPIIPVGDCNSSSSLFNFYATLFHCFLLLVFNPSRYVARLQNLALQQF